jgi:hypothetical protein
VPGQRTPQIRPPAERPPEQTPAAVQPRAGSVHPGYGSQLKVVFDHGFPSM